MNLLSQKFIAEYDEHRDAYCIIHPDREQFEDPLIEIARETLESMTYAEASQFIGERLILLTPSLKEMFKDYLWTDDGHTPPKLP